MATDRCRLAPRPHRSDSPLLPLIGLAAEIMSAADVLKTSGRRGAERVRGASKYFENGSQPYCAKSMKATQEAVTKILVSAGYKLYDMEDRSRGRMIGLV